MTAKIRNDVIGATEHMKAPPEQTAVAAATIAEDGDCFWKVDELTPK